MTQYHIAIGQIDSQRSAGCDAADAPRAIMLSRADAAVMLAFYAALEPREQRARFGAAMTHAMLSGHCQALDWANVAVAAWMDGDRITAIAELHLSTAAHEAVELAVACVDRSQAQPVWRDAIRLASAAAAGRGCRTLQVVANLPDPLPPTLLREAGAVRLLDGVWVCALGQPGARA